MGCENSGTGDPLPRRRPLHCAEDGVLLAESYQNSGLTHSRTLLPMCQTMLDNCGHQLSEVDVIAVASRPRLLHRAAHRLCPPPKDWPGRARHALLSGCPRWRPWPGIWHTWTGSSAAPWTPGGSQVYNALFEAEDGQLTRLTPDRAIALAELCHGENGEKRPQILVGDGAELCYNDASRFGASCAFGPSAPAAPACQRGRPCRMGADSASGGGKPPIRRSAASQLPASVSGRAGTAGADEAGGRPGLKAIVLRFSG